MKSSLVSKLADKDSSKVLGTNESKPTMPRRMAEMQFAHFLGFDAPKPKATAKAQPVTASAPRKPAARPAPSATPAPAQRSAMPKAATKPTAKAAKPAMPFSEAIGLTNQAHKAPQTTRKDANTLRVPEVVNGVATGHYLEVTRPKAEAPKLDASAIARRIVAAGKRVFGK